MNDIITIRGVVATTPRHLVTEEGLAVTSFRVLTSNRVFDPEAEAWHRSDGNWFTVSTYRQLASNVAGCVGRGDPVLVSGSLRVREWSSAAEAAGDGVTAEIEAEAIGHDLAWGSALFARTVASTGSGAQSSARPDAEPGDGRDADAPEPGSADAPSQPARRLTTVPQPPLPRMRENV